jgi:hypothetical protein
VYARRRWVVVVLAVAVTSVIACAQLSGLSDLTRVPAEAGSTEPATSGPDNGEAGGGALDRVDAGADDANPDAPVATETMDAGWDAACPPFAVFCDNFELGDLSRWTGGVDTLCNGSTIGIYDASVPPAPFRGAFGLRAVIMEAGVAGCGASAEAIFPTAPSPGTLAVRVYINGAVLEPAANTDFMALRPRGSYTSSAAIFDGPTGWSTAVSSNFVERDTNSAVGIPSGWFCVEWDILYAPRGGRQRLFVDRNTGNGLELIIDDVDVDFGDASATWNVLDLGVVSGGVINSSVDLRYDDVAIAIFPGIADADAGPRIGCE